MVAVLIGPTSTKTNNNNKMSELHNKPAGCGAAESVLSWALVVEKKKKKV
jgi:hypothetical protein